MTKWDIAIVMLDIATLLALTVFVTIGSPFIAQMMRHAIQVRWGI